MARTSSAAVQGILLQDYNSVTQPSLTPFIDSASMFIDSVAICATAKNTTLTDYQLEILERWVAAHLYCMVDQPYSHKRTENAEGWFQGTTGMRLDATKYGQTAQMLDPTGCVAGVAKKRKVRIMWAGKPPSEQINYEDRD